MNIYYRVYEYTEDSKRLIHVFENPEAAHGLIDYLYKHDIMHSRFDMEEYEAPTKL